MKIIAFDIDGVLTTDQGMEKFIETVNKGEDIVGIVTARSNDNAIKFVESNNLNVDFLRATPFKGIALNNLADEYNVDEKIYYGSWFRDRVHAKLWSWNYKQL